ncbi:hypothetical protein MHTCC0001_04790 [Flavobacteriaceae bacterium MHTCC 0001]
MLLSMQLSYAQATNIALNKPTQQSSTVNNNHSSFAVDGNYSNGSISETNNEANPWWQIDLGSSFDVSLIKLYNRTDSFQDRLANFYVFVADTDLSNRSFSDVVSDCSVTHIYVTDAVVSQLNIPGNISGRYIKIQLAETNALSLAEVEVFETITSNTICNGFCVLDDFDGRLNGSIRGQGNWQTNPPGATDGAIVNADPGDGFLGKALMNDPNGVQFRGNAYLPLEDLEIPENEEGTLFFQISGDDLLNTHSHIGLTDLVSPRLTDKGSGDLDLEDDYKVQLSIDNGQFSVENGTTTNNITNIILENGVVYNVWLTIDNQNDDFEVFVQGGIHLLPIKAITADGTSSFSFKSTTTKALQTLYLLNSADNVATGVMFYDNFYIDHQNINLSIPVTLSKTFDFFRIDDFNNLNTGVLNNQNQWVSNSNTIIVEVDPENSTNKILTLGSGSINVYRTLTRTIRPCDIGTVFFRMKRNGLINENLGLSDVGVPSEFSDFENQINFQDNDVLSVRDGGEFTALTTLENNQWYNVWMVTNNPTDTYKIYIQSEGDNEPVLLSSGAQNVFNYRNGSASNPLTAFFIKQDNSSGSFSLDDIYIDHSQENLNFPTRELFNLSNSPLDDPIPESISKNGIGVVLEEFVTIPASDANAPFARINFLGHANDSSGRVFVNDLRNSLYIIQNQTVSEYLNVSAQFPDFTDAPRLGTGFGFFAFHPEFATNGKFYTVHTEHGDALNTVPDFTSFGTDTMHGIITEWTATNPFANTFSGSRREVLRIGFDTALHGFQQIGFNPAATAGDADYGLLYLALGDGEENPVFSGAPQDLSVPHGKILRIDPLRIDPLGNNAANGNYGIPPLNPFIGNNNALGEIWAYGFRNPHRFSWDSGGTHKMFIANIGEKNIDAIYLGEPGANYGWNRREGSFLFKTTDPNNVFALPENDAISNYTYPVAQYDHDEGFAIVGGFVYRGDKVPSLYGKYVFGDIVKGRLFYCEASEMTSNNQFTEIHELIIYDESEQETNLLGLINASRADLRFGMDQEGELYVLSKQNGKIWKIIEPSITVGTSSFETYQIKTYPNPVSKTLHINSSNKITNKLTLTIFNGLGQQLKTLTLNNNKDKINISVDDLPTGIYVLKLSMGSKIWVKKFIKN